MRFAYIWLLSTLFALSNAFAAGPVSNPSGGCGPGYLGVAGLCLSTANLIKLHTGILANNNSVFYNVSFGSTPAVYQVTTAKTFYPYAYRCEQAQASGTSSGTSFIYSDNNVTVDSSTAMTNPVCVITNTSGGTSTDCYVSSNQMSGGTTNIKEGTMGGKVPAGKYINMHAGMNGWCDLYGYER